MLSGWNFGFVAVAYLCRCWWKRMLHVLTQPISPPTMVIKGGWEEFGERIEMACGLHSRGSFIGVCIWTPSSSSYAH